jgi:phosphoribosylaminoimidazolecarboxamide formyltransferase/IMP cyclohydrolase
MPSDAPPASSSPASTAGPEVRRALVSVYDKTGVVPFARRLAEHGVEILSTGGTAARLREADVPVTDVADVTGMEEMLDGRVKTLHPSIHAALLARRDREDDMAALKAKGIAPIDLVACNLYPFREVAREGDADLDAAMANVDIGGPTMIRAAAKNHAAVTVVSSPSAYDAVADEIEANNGRITPATRRRLAADAFAHTAAYDRAIHHDLAARDEGPAGDAPGDGRGGDGRGGDEAASSLPDPYRETLPQALSLRYGENPHQRGALYGSPETFFTKLHGRDLSFNNLLDLTGAFRLIDEFRDADPTVAILKHTNPCGVATDTSLERAWERAFATDRQSPYGGIVAVNRPLDRATAEAIDEIFTEIIIAPAFEPGVVDFLTQKKRRRIVRKETDARNDMRLDARSVLGGMLVQTLDPVLPSDPARREWETATDRSPTEAEEADLDFAWRVVKHVKSNAIVYARNRATLGIGAGQMSRIDASEIAVQKAEKSELDLTGSVVASDAFFPFADGLVAAAEQGAQAAIQPGGSIRDDEVIEAADAHDVAMVLTGRRHFRH